MRRLILSLITFVAMQTAALAQSNPGFIQGRVPTVGQWNSYFSGKTDALGGTLTNGIILNGTIDGAAIGATTPALGGFTKLTLTPPTVTGLAASANGYTIEQDMTYNLSSSASGIYFGNEFNTVVNGDPRSGAQVWNNLDRMFAKTAATSTANLVNRDIQSVRPFGFGTPKQTLWGLIVDVVDETGLDSLHGGGLLGLELDLQANDLDNSPDVTRQGIVVSLFHGNGTGSGGVSPQATSALGVFSAGDGAANFKSIIQLAAPFHDAAVDGRSSSAVAGGTPHFLWLGSSLDIALDTPGSNTINYNSGFNGIALNQASTVLFYANVAGAHYTVPLTADATGLGLSVTNNATIGGTLGVMGLLGVSSASVSAAGTTQGTATALAAQTNIITAAASGTGVVVPASAPLMRVSNRAPNPVNVFPNSGAQIEAFGTNNPVSLGVGADVVIGCTSSTQCRAYP